MTSISRARKLSMRACKKGLCSTRTMPKVVGWSRTSSRCRRACERVRWSDVGETRARAPQTAAFSRRRGPPRWLHFSPLTLICFAARFARATPKFDQDRHIVSSTSIRGFKEAESNISGGWDQHGAKDEDRRCSIEFASQPIMACSSAKRPLSGGNAAASYLRHRG